MTRVFFYGLFMDKDLLEEMGLHPEVIGPARLDDFELRIGNLAALIPTRGSESFGIVIDLPGREVEALYSNPKVADYQPEDVDAVLLADGSSQRCVCYNLPARMLGSTANPKYAESLSKLVSRLGLPAQYAEEISNQRGT